MKSRCNKFSFARKGFTLIEVVTATGILALIASSVWVVIDRCVTSSANTTLKMQAFEVARENMENLLSKNSITETTEYGFSDRYPGIEWETCIETFYEPINSQMWLRGVCIAKYDDVEGNKKTVELTHWLTGLTKEQLLQILMQQEEEQYQLASQLIETIEDAAIYAGVSTNTIEKWIDNGMLTTEDGFFIKKNLDLFNLHNGNPNQEDKNNMQIKSEDDFKQLEVTQKWEELQNEIDPKTGLTYGEIEQMDITEIWDILKNKQNSNQN